MIVQHTSVDNVVVMKIVDSFQDLPYRLRTVLFCKLALLNDALKQLAARS